MRDQLAIARRIILAYGWNSTCYQLLNPGIERWISSDELGLVGFVESHGMAVVAGAPVCRAEELSHIISEWEEYAQSRKLSVCYFGAEARLQASIMHSMKHSTVILGYQPEWKPVSFISKVESSKLLRAQLNRSLNKGVSVSEWPAALAENNPSLQAVLAEWLMDRGLPPLHFLVEPETLSDLADRRIFVAQLDERIVGFVTLCPVPARNGWLTEQFVRSNRAPNGTVELMLYTAIKAIAMDQAEYVTMGIVPLVDRNSAIKTLEPLWLVGIRRWSIAHLARFYNFAGLANFKSKFLPDEWQPVVVIVQGPNFSIRHLRAITQAFTITSPELALAKGVFKAFHAEVSRLFSTV